LLKPLSFNILHHLPNIVLGTSSASLRGQPAAQLAAPWPDLVIATGKRTAPVARWIRKQSGGRTRIVQLGRPRAPLSAFDLVVTTPQYGLPTAGNVVETLLPFATAHRPEPGAVKKWSAAWSQLPKPWIAMVIGAPRFPLRMGKTEIVRLAEAADRLAAASGGSLLVLGSPRTPQGMVEKIGARLHVPAIPYPWNAAENPYQAALALADRFVVTSDSASMLGETVGTGKPADIFILPASRVRFGWQAKAGLAAWLSRKGILQPPRDMSRLVREIIARGYARPLGSDMTTKRMNGGAGDDVVTRIKAMFEAP
jgi:mitochondrial fission protein ELM1